LVGDEDDSDSSGHTSGRRIITIERTDKDRLSDAQWDCMARVAGYIGNHLSQGGPEQDA
jgi:hypothetical protein